MTILLVKLSILVLLTSALWDSAGAANDPQADPKAVVTAGKARFTVLSSQLIRMEWGQALDAATFTVINRRLPVIDFEKSMNGDWLVLDTHVLVLRYLTTAETAFDQHNLEVTFGTWLIKLIYYVGHTMIQE